MPIDYEDLKPTRISDFFSGFGGSFTPTEVKRAQAQGAQGRRLAEEYRRTGNKPPELDNFLRDRVSSVLNLFKPSSPEKSPLKRVPSLNKDHGKDPRLARAQMALKGFQGNQEPAWSPSQYSGNFSDFLRMAQGMLPGMDSLRGGWDNRRAEAKSQADLVDSRLSAMYARAQEEMRESLPSIQENIGHSLDDIDTRADQDLARIQSVRDANRNAEAEALERSGIGDSVLLSEQRQRADGDSEGSVGRIMERAGTQRDVTRELGNISEDLARGRIDTTGAQGLRNRELNQMKLSDLLARYADEEVQWQNQIQAQQQQQALQLASQLYNQDYGAWSNYQNQMMQHDNNMYGRAWQEEGRDYDRQMALNQMQMSQDQAAYERMYPQLTGATASLFKELSQELSAPEVLRMMSAMGYLPNIEPPQG